MWRNGSIILEYVCLMMSDFILSHTGLRFFNFSTIILISLVVIGAKTLSFYKFHQDYTQVLCNRWYVVG